MTTHNGPSASSSHAPKRHKQGNGLADEINGPEKRWRVEKPDVDMCEDVVACAAAIVDFLILGVQTWYRIVVESACDGKHGRVQGTQQK